MLSWLYFLSHIIFKMKLISFHEVESLDKVIYKNIHSELFI